MTSSFAPQTEKEKSQARPAPAPEEQPSLQDELGAPAGMPLFLQRTSVAGGEDADVHHQIDEATAKTGWQPGRSKLIVGPANDVYEWEADRVAEVAARGETRPKTPVPPSPHHSPAMSSLPFPDTGAPLPEKMKERVEPVLGVDLGHVRIHTGPAATDAAKRFHARAFTHQNHIWLGPNQSADDLQLMAHESAHVVQQGASHRRSPGSAPQIQRQPEVAPATENAAKDDQILRGLQAAPGANLINYATSVGGLAAWKARYPRSYEEMRARAVKRYGETAFDKLLERESEILPLLQKSGQVVAKLQELNSLYLHDQQSAAADVVQFYTGYYLLFEGQSVRGFYELDYVFFAELFARNPSADLTLLKLLLDRDVNAIVAGVREQAELAQSEEDAKAAQRREWAAKGAKVLGTTVAKKQGWLWDTNIKLESVLQPDYGSEDPQEMLAVARMSGLMTAVVKVEDRYYAYKLDEQYNRKDLFLLPDKDAFVQILPAGPMPGAVFAITATTGYVLRPPPAWGELYRAGDQEDNPLAHLEADTKLLETGRTHELGISALDVFQSMVMNLALVNLSGAERRMKEIQSQMKRSGGPDPDPAAGDRLKKDSARLREIMLELTRLEAEVGGKDLTDEQTDRRDALMLEAGGILERDPGAGLFVENTRDPESKEKVEESDIKNKIADEDAGNAAQKAWDEAQERLDNIAKVRRAIFDNPTIALDFDVLHAPVLARFDSGDQTRIKLGLIGHTLANVARTLGIVATDLVLLLAGFVTGGETWVGLGVHAAGAGFGLYQFSEQVKQAQLTAAMSSLDVEGGFALASKGAARSARNWAIIAGVLNFLALAGLARTASRLFAASAREANLVGRMARQAGVTEEVLDLALRRSWRGLADPDPGALRQILLAGMDPLLARRYQNIAIRVLDEKDWIARFGPNSAEHAVTNFSKSAGGELVAHEVLFRRTGNIFALQEEAAHISQAADPRWAEAISDVARLNPAEWAGLSAVDKLRATRKVLEIELDAQEKLLARAQQLGDTEGMDDAFAQMENLSQRIVAVDDKLVNPASTRYLSWFEPGRPPSIFASPRLPRSLGEWSGVPGKSVWNSKNPDVLAITGGEGVQFRNGYPDFSKWSRGQVNLGEMSGYGSDFAEADAAFAKGVMNRTREVPAGFTREDFIYRGEPNASTTKLYRQQAGLTWHHHQGGKLMLLVPTKLHANVPHTGGASAARAAGE